MKAVRLHAYREAPRLDEVPEPVISGPHDVIVRVGGAGLCRTDVHIRDGWFAPAVPAELPLTLGHENTGWVHEIGPGGEGWRLPRADVPRDRRRTDKAPGEARLVRATRDTPEITAVAARPLG